MRESLPAGSDPPCFSNEVEGQAAIDPLRFKMGEPRILKTDARVAIAVGGASIVDGDQTRRIINYKASAGFALMPDLDQLATVIDADLHSVRLVTRANFPQA